MLFLMSPLTIYFKIIYQNCVDNFEIEHKNFGVGGAVPLNTLSMSTHIGWHHPLKAGYPPLTDFTMQRGYMRVYKVFVYI